MKKHQIALVIIILFAILGNVSTKSSLQSLKQKNQRAQAVNFLASRILGDRLAQNITFNLIEQDLIVESRNETGYNEYFILSSPQENELTIQSNTKIGLSKGLFYYMKNYMNSSISWNGDNIQQLEYLPTLKEQIRIQTPYQFRYMFNYCTYSYSLMSFWDWQRWEREIDYMALQGINMPLAIIGTSKIWQNTLKSINYTDSEILDFLPGPGFEAWWLMGNLEGYGGPVTQSYIDGQYDLQKKILKRMRNLGMQPILQGFYGMVPNSLKAKFPLSKIYGDQSWLGFRRPAFLDANDELFAKIANIFYSESEKLYGRAKFYGGDPFHEGAIVPGLNLTSQAQSIYKAMQYTDNPKDEKVKWILQSWQENPSQQLLQGLKNDECIILDLMAEARSKWQTNDFSGHNFLWTSLPNFGLRIGQYGMIEQYVSQPPLAYSIKNSTMKGIGSIPEGILTNVLDYEILFDKAWIQTNQDTNLTPRQQVLQYLGDFIRYRYGEENNKNLFSAWSLLTNSIYNSTNPWDGPSESIMLARPASNVDKVSSWGTSYIYWNTTNVLEAWKFFTNYVKERKQRNRSQHLQKLEEINKKLGRSDDDMEAFVEISDSEERNLFKDTFLYDLVDLARQNLASYSYLLYNKVMMAFNQTDTIKFALYSQQFLELIKDQDQLLSSRKEFMLGYYLESVSKLGSTDQEKENFIEQIKRQITVWSDFPSDLHDYANKEWNGILKDFYLPRWELYFKSLETFIIEENKKQELAQLQQQQSEEGNVEVQEETKLEEESDLIKYTKEDLLSGKNINWYDVEIKFSKNNITYPSTPQISELEINQALFQKYYSVILAEHININQIRPTVQKQYGIRLQPKQHQTYTQVKFSKDKQNNGSAETQQI
ncbi:hypothetical protein ABPG74_002506 [Tetrahymena malaccensis]